MTVAYDGREFFGSQRQEARRTVQGRATSGRSGKLAMKTCRRSCGSDRSRGTCGRQVVSLADYRPDLRRPDRAEGAERASARRSGGDGGRATADSDSTPDTTRAGVSTGIRVWTGSATAGCGGMVWQRSGSLDLDAMRAGAIGFDRNARLGSFAGGGEGVPGSERQSRRAERCDRIDLRRRAAATWWRRGVSTGN